MTRPSVLMATASTPPVPAGIGRHAIGFFAIAGPAAAPSLIQRSRSPSWAGLIAWAPTLFSGGGMKSSWRWAERRNTGLSAALPAMTPGPESPPVRIALRESRISPPSWILALWQAVQLAARTGRISS